MSCPTQHDAVADRDDLETRFVALEPGEDELESAFAVETLLVPGLRVDPLALRVLGGEARL